jgi:ribA/ribD-fused uncharacterized protein
MPICTINNLSLCTFYDKNDNPWYSLTNYSADKITIFDELLKKNITWPTAEHYFQAQKIINPTVRARFISDMQNKGPNDCRTQVKNYQPQDPNWHNNQTKQNVMLKALRAKYEQHPQIKKLLDSTGNMPIVEDTAGASYQDNDWGCGWEGKGDNWLGVLWMQVRAEKRDNKNSVQARKEALALQEKAKKVLISLGNRQGQLLQNYAHVKLGAPTLKPMEPISLISLAQRACAQMKTGDKISFTGSDGTKITYGISQQHKTFYIHGVGRGNKPYDVYVKNGKTVENGKTIATSRWGEWAAEQVWAHLNKTKKPQIDKQLINIINHQVPWKKSLLFSSFMAATLGIALALCGMTAALVALAAVTVATMTMFGCLLIRQINAPANLEAYKNAMDSIDNQERLGAFLDGAKNTFGDQLQSCFSYRDWRYMQDYYAGQCAQEAQETQLIQSVAKKYRASV